MEPEFVDAIKRLAEEVNRLKVTKIIIEITGEVSQEQLQSLVWAVEDDIRSLEVEQATLYVEEP